MLPAVTSGKSSSRKLAQLSVAQVEAFIGRQKLVDRWKASDEFVDRKPEWAEPEVHPIDERIERIHRAPIGSAECYQCSRDLAPTELLQKPTGDKPTHRMADKDELGVGLPVLSCCQRSSCGTATSASLRALSSLESRQS